MFISHSARNDPDATVELEAIADLLEGKGFEVLLDKTRLTGGEHWRNCLHTWMGHCHAAVILLTPKALASPWVLKEATILSWRESLSPPSEFLLRPVLLNLSSTALQQSDLFSPLNLTEIQALKGIRGSTLAETLAAQFEPLLQTARLTPRRRMENVIAQHLSAITRPALFQDVEQELTEDLGGWDPQRDAAGRIAMLLLQASFDRMMAGLEMLIDVVPKENLLKLVEWLVGVWIDPELAAMLGMAAKRPPGSRAVSLNSSSPEFTSKALIARASGSPPLWTSITTSDGAGDDLAGSLVAQIRAALERQAQSNKPREVEDYVEAQVARRPIVVVLPPDADPPILDDSLIDRLLQEFPKLTLFVASGEHPLPTGRLDRVVRLSPALDCDRERAARAEYFRFLNSARLNEVTQ